MRGVRPENETVGGEAKVVHLHDLLPPWPNDDHLVPTEGGLNWYRVLEKLKSIDYSGDIIFEAVRDIDGFTDGDLLAKKCKALIEPFSKFLGGKA